MLKKIRVTVAALVFAAFLLLLLDRSGYAHQSVAFLAKLQLVPALLALNFLAVVAILVVTFVFGRIYCSVLCPLGIMQDIFSRLGAKRRKNRFGWKKPATAVRVVFLVAFAALMTAGFVSFAAIIEPYSTFGRIVTAATEGNAVTVGASAALFFIIAAMSFFGGRLWCNTVCPAGTILGAVARYSLFRPVIDISKCNGCTLCARNCKCSCIDARNHSIDLSRCVACMDCIDKCTGGAISYKFAGCRCLSCKGTKKEGETDTSRRAFLATAALVSGAATLGAEELKMDGGLAVLQDKKVPQRGTPLKPAGSQSLKNFDTRCVSCQLCVSKCPSGVLRPSSSLETLMQPELDYRLGWCRPSCNVCSQVCPAGAIKPVTVEEKSSISIGHAVWVRENCIVVTDGVECGNCQRHCPAGAIVMVSDGFGSERKVPSVNAERCIGCGSCEYHCPARPVSAIFVQGHEVHSIK